MPTETDATNQESLTPRKLVLVDAYSLLFRAFFAGRYLSTADNRPTGALFGFANMIFAILNNEKPQAVVVCWDAHEQTHRSKEFQAYKAHRPDADPQLVAQMPLARQLVAAFGIQSAEIGGYEADDLIGTLAKKGANEGYSVVILTGDSDQLQLVTQNVAVQMTQRGVSEVKTYSPQTVLQRYGVPPERIPDWKALVGDASDNIPGVPGIGEKTATALLQKWETLENLLEHASQATPPKAAAALQAGIEQARLSKRLATIVCDIPAELPIQPYDPTPEDWTRLRDLFAELEFKSLLARIPKPDDAPLTYRETLTPETAFATAVVRITTLQELADALQSALRAGVIALLPHSDSPSPMRAQLRGIAFAPAPEVGYYVPIRQPQTPADPETDPLGGLFLHPSSSILQPSEPEWAADPQDLLPLLQNPDIRTLGHNVKFAEILLERLALQPQPFAFDTLIAAYLLNSGRSSYPLIDLAETYLGVRLDADAYAPEESLAQEAALVHALEKPLQQRMDEMGVARLMEEIEMPLVPILAAIEQTGLYADKAYLETLSARMASELDALAKQVYALAGEEFNIGSTKQLQTILFEKLQLPAGKKIKTGYTTNADLLEQLAPQYPICRKILDYREVAKLKSTYADALPKLVHPQTGRIHTSLNQTVAATGRLSSADPNLQNIPIRSEIGREIRRAFIAPPGRLLLSCDYSQIELRILAHVTKDPALVQAFALDEDIHAATAAKVFNVPLEEVTPDQRRQAKTINFGVIYGQSGFGLAGTLGVETKVAGEWIKDYFANLPGIERYIEETREQARRQKYVSTLLGRRRFLPELDSGNHAMRQAAERAAVNMPIQGTAADIMKLAMIAVWQWVRRIEGCSLLLQVHDELLFEVEEALVPQVAPEIISRMEKAYPLDVRLKVDAKSGANWADMKPL